MDKIKWYLNGVVSYGSKYKYCKTKRTMIDLCPRTYYLFR